MHHKTDETKIITLTEKAREIIQEFFEKTEPKLIDELSDIAQFAGKLSGAILRIAGLLYLASDVVNHDNSELILSENFISSAIHIGEYFLEHAKAAYQLMGADENQKNAEYILQKIIKNHIPQATKTELVRICRKFKSTEQMTEPLKILIDFNYLREVEQEYNGTGRKPENIYFVNPQIL